MDVTVIKAIPKPVNVREAHGYRVPVKNAKLSGIGNILKASRVAKDLLAECCEAENLPAPVPNFLEIHDSSESGTLILAKPVMAENDFTIPVTVAKGEVKVDLFQFLLAKKVKTVHGTRLVIPISSTTIPGWGSALVLHMGALEWVPIKRRGEEDDLKEKNT